MIAGLETGDAARRRLISFVNIESACRRSLSQFWCEVGVNADITCQSSRSNCARDKEVQRVNQHHNSRKKEKIMNIQFNSSIPNGEAPGRVSAGMRPLGNQGRIRLALLALVIISHLTVGGSRVSAQTETSNQALTCQDVQLPVSLQEGQPANYQ